jgi:hypothetical protein
MRQRALDAYGKLPLSFIPNAGQMDPSVRFYAQGAGYGFYFTDDRAVLAFTRRATHAERREMLGLPGRRRDGPPTATATRGVALELRFLGASPTAKLHAKRRGTGTVNYLLGADPAQWRRELPTYEQLAYQGLWPGVDMRFRGAGGELKYEFVLGPGASPQRIRLAYAGAEDLSLGRDGSLLIDTPLGTLEDARPRAHQHIGGRNIPVETRYVLMRAAGGGRGYGFKLGAYDPRYHVVVDPGLAYSTFLGGTGTDLALGIAVDRRGSAYVTGSTGSADFPTTAGAFDTSHNGGGDDAFVTKLDAAGRALVYSTFLGGTSSDFGLGIAVDRRGSAYVTGSTTSADFPTTAGAFDASFNGNSDAFVTKLDAAGNALAYSTFLGSISFDGGFAIAVDRRGSAYVTGSTLSADFPTTAGAFDTSLDGFGFGDAFVTKLDAAGDALAYSTFLGGTGGETARGIAVDRRGSAYVTGEVSSADFPTTAAAFDASFNGGGDDAFVTKLDATGGALAYSTFLGGMGADLAKGVAVDRRGSAYVTGETFFSSDFPTTAGAFDTSLNGFDDAFVTKLDATGDTLAYSTFLGGSAFETGYGIAVDRRGSAYVTGSTESADFPTSPDAFDTSRNGEDAFVTKLNAAGGALAYSTFLGGSGFESGFGIAVDRRGSAYVTGSTTSADFPTSAGAFDTSFNGNGDAFVTKLDLD